MDSDPSAISPDSPTNLGPWNTVVAVFLIVASVLISLIRYALGYRRVAGLALDDGIFGVGLLFAVAMSLVSQQMVRFGAGRHRDTLRPEQVDMFYKVHYTTHFLAVISMTCSKASLVLLFRRIMLPSRLPLTMKLLLPMVVGSGVVSLFLVGFQCETPQPWRLEPTCSNGQLHYVATALNIFTDVLAALWIVYPIWKLQTNRGTRLVVVSLLLSRLVVCGADISRFNWIRRALYTGNREDTTWQFIGWILMDQVVVHLSLNHASLPRVHVFLRDLQTGLAVSRIAAGDLNMGTKGFEKDSSKRYLNSSDKRSSTGVTALDTTTKSGRFGFFNPLKSKTGSHAVSEHKDPHSSQTHLQLQPDMGTEMSTFVSGGDGNSTSSAGQSKADDKEGLGNACDSYEVAAGLGNETTRVPAGRIKMEQTVEIFEDERKR